MKHAVFIFEFKVVEIGVAPGSAIKQIKKKKYAEKYLGGNVPVYIIGCEFCKSDRNITAFEWEQA